MKKQQGITLIELMTALTIIAILVMVSYPYYRQSLVKSHRQEATTALLQCASLMERYFSDHQSYEGATIANIGAKSSSRHGHYTLSITEANAGEFNIQAAPVDSNQDNVCGTFRINHLGQKTQTGSGSFAECWA